LTDIINICILKMTIDYYSSTANMTFVQVYELLMYDTSL